MQFIDLEIKDAFIVFVDAFSTGFFDEHAQRVTFIEYTQFSFGIGAGGWIQEDAAETKGAVHIRNHAADIPQGLVLSGAMVEIAADTGAKALTVALVDAIVFAALRDAHIGMTETELPDTTVVGKSIDGSTGGVYKHCRCAVKDITGCNQFGTPLTEVSSPGGDPHAKAFYRFRRWFQQRY